MLLSIRPGSIIKTKAGHSARVIWTDATKKQLGVFFIKNRGGSYGVLDYCVVAECDDSSPWIGLDRMSNDEIKERLRPLVKQISKKTKSAKLADNQQQPLVQAAIKDLPEDIQNQLRQLGVIK